jgi:hypothetical protein
MDYREHLQKYPDGSGRTHVVFEIPRGTSKGRPRKGWDHLLPYLDKNLSPLLMDMNKRQFDIYLYAVHCGDGSKAKGVGSYKIACARKTFADRFQSLCVRLGWKCNIAEDPATAANGRKQMLYQLNIVDTRDSILHGPGAKSPHKIATLVKGDPQPGERVWCLANRLETLVTRRNGKVAIIGNSYWRHGSPNHDRPWDKLWNLSERAVSEYHQKQIQEGKQPEPIRCPPPCNAERKSGPKCPICGRESSKSHRHVVMEDGKLVEVEGSLIQPKRVPVQQSPEQQQWSNLYFSWKHGKGSTKTFAQMYGYYKSQTGKALPKDLNYMPVRAEDWSRRVGDVEYHNLRR